jgi:hypothetical protein
VSFWKETEVGEVAVLRRVQLVWSLLASRMSSFGERIESEEAPTMPSTEEPARS